MVPWSLDRELLICQTKVSANEERVEPWMLSLLLRVMTHAKVIVTLSRRRSLHQNICASGTLTSASMIIMAVTLALIISPSCKTRELLWWV